MISTTALIAQAVNNISKFPNLKSKIKPALSARNKALKLRSKTALPESLKLKLALRNNSEDFEAQNVDQETDHNESQNCCSISPINWEVNHEDDELFEKESIQSASENNSTDTIPETFTNGRQKSDNVSRGPYLPPKIKALFRNTRYYLIKSCNHENVALAKSRCVWATPRCNEIRLNKAFEECDNVILIFSVKESGRFQGYARISAKSDPSIRVGWVLPAGMNQRHLSGAFRIDWVSKAEVPFSMTSHLNNNWNDNKPVKIGRDGQDIEANCGESLCRLFPLENERLIDAIHYKNQSNRPVIDYRKNTSALLPSPVNLPPKPAYEDYRNKSRNNHYIQHGNRQPYNNGMRQQTPTMNRPPPVNNMPPPCGLPPTNHLPPMNLAAPPPPLAVHGRPPPMQFAPQRFVANPPVVHGFPPPMRPPQQLLGPPPMHYVIQPGQPPVSIAPTVPHYQPHPAHHVLPHQILNYGQPVPAPGTYPQQMSGHNFLHPTQPLPPTQQSYPPGMLPPQGAPAAQIPQIHPTGTYPAHQPVPTHHPPLQPVYSQQATNNYGARVDGAVPSQAAPEPPLRQQQQAQSTVPYVESGSTSWSTVSKDQEKSSRHTSSHRQKSPHLSRSSRHDDHHNKTESRRRSPDLVGIDKELLMKGDYHDYLRYSTGQDKRHGDSKQKDDKSQYEDRVASFLMQLSSRDPPRKSSKNNKSRKVSPKRGKSSSSSVEYRSRSRDVPDYRKAKRPSPSHSRHKRKSRSNSRSRRKR